MKNINNKLKSPALPQENLGMLDSLGAISPYLSMASGGIQLLSSLLTDPSNYQPVKQNNMSGYAVGGTIKQDPPTKENNQMQRESTYVNMPLISYNNNRPMDTLATNDFTAKFNRFVAGDKWADNMYNTVTQLNKEIIKNNSDRASRGEFEPNYKLGPIMNTGAGGDYAAGGDIKLSENSMQVQGNLGVDTNQRMVEGKNVNLTKGETVQKTRDGAFVFSNSPDMLNPQTGNTFADDAKPTQKKIGEIENKMKKSGYDKIAKSTIEALNKDLDKLAELQQSLNNNNQGQTTQGNFAVGGIIPGLQNMSNAIYSAQPRLIANQPTTMLPNSLQVNMQDYRDNQPAIDVPKLSTYPGKDSGWKSILQKVNRAIHPSYQGQRDAKAQSTAIGSPIGDKVNMATDVVSVLGQGILAGQKPEQYKTDRYNIDRQIYDPTQALNRNTRNYNAANYSINSGNANTDRVNRANTYASKLNADNDVLSQYQQMQRTSDLSVNQANQASKLNVDQINAQNRGAGDTAISRALQSLAGIGSEYQDYSNSNLQNNITVQTLNSLSSRYGISQSALKAMMKNDPEGFNKMLVEYKQQ